MNSTFLPGVPTLMVKDNIREFSFAEYNNNNFSQYNQSPNPPQNNNNTAQNNVNNPQQYKIKISCIF